jgi:plasmid replication initiation protein
MQKTNELEQKQEIIDFNMSSKGDGMVVQPYFITMSRHSMNIHSLRIMTRIIQALQPKIQFEHDRSVLQETLFGDVIITFPTKDLLPENSKNHATIKAALDALEKEKIQVTGKDSHGEYITNARLIMKYKYYLNNQRISIQLDRDLLPDLLALSKNYSKYLVDVVFNSSSTYTARIYMFVSHWKDKNEIKVYINSLRDWLNLGDKYTLSNDFKKHILEPAAVDLKERADVWFEIKHPIKEGRAIVGYTLKLYKRNNNQALNMANHQNIKNILMELFGFKAYHLKKLEGILAKPELHVHIHDKIHDIYKYMQNGDIKNIKAYAIKSLLNEFGDKELEIE